MKKACQSSEITKGEVALRRQRLAHMIGKLLAHTWLSRRESEINNSQARPQNKPGEDD